MTINVSLSTESAKNLVQSLLLETRTLLANVLTSQTGLDTVREAGVSVTTAQGILEDVLAEVSIGVDKLDEVTAARAFAIEAVSLLDSAIAEINSNTNSRTNIESALTKLGDVENLIVEILQN